MLDAGGLSALAANRALLEVLREDGNWPAEVPTVVLTECLTGDHRRDYHVNRVLRACRMLEIDEPLARGAARLRTGTGRAGTISAVDAIVVALAASRPDAVVITGDPHDIRALAAQTSEPPRIVVV